LVDSAEVHVVANETSPLLPTATGFAVRQAIEAFKKQGIAVAPFLAQAGLSGRHLDLGENPPEIAAAAQAKFLDLAADALDDSAFGLHLAQQIDPRDVGIFYYIGSCGENVREALALYSRYCRIVNEAVRQNIKTIAGGAIVEIEFVGLPKYAVRQNTEFILACFVPTLRQLTGRDIRVTAVAFGHPRNADLKEFERFFGCPVDFGGGANILTLADETLDTPLLTADPRLLRAIQPFCDRAAKGRRAVSGTLRAAVETEIEKLLPLGKAKAQTVAKKLALSVRTLSRRLAGEGATYAEIVDQLRRSLALQYVKEPSMSVSQIAWLLGYEGSTSFNHAFQRWTGSSPSSARKRELLRSTDK
jgi:AraC-like DNA-binding protein